jgi:hypothetical protein
MTYDKFSRFLAALGAEARLRGVAFFEHELTPPPGEQYLWDDCSQWEEVFEHVAWAAGGPSLAAGWRTATAELRRGPSDRDAAGRSRSLLDQLAERRRKAERLACVGADWLPLVHVAAWVPSWQDREDRYWQLMGRRPTYATLRGD